MATALWPNTAELSIARANLRKSLMDLRHLFASLPLPVDAKERSLRFLPNAGIQVDVLRFDALIRKKDEVSLHEAVAVYQAELLKGWEEEIWALFARSEHQRRFESAVRTLFRHALQERQYEQAGVLLRRLLSFEIIEEADWHALIEAQWKAGESAGAYASYREAEACWQHLWNESLPASLQRLYRQMETEIRGRSVRQRRHKPVPLPLPPDGFFGREAERKTLRHWLLTERQRLVALIGPGGVGKTRLALETLDMAGSRFAGRCWFVPLADVPDANGIGTAILRALGRAVTAACPPLEEIVDALSRKSAPSLMALDNLEHLMPESIGLIQELLERVPTLACLITSRRSLAMGKSLALAPLPIPQEGEKPQRLLRNAGIQMFAARAQKVSQDFELTKANVEAVGGICHLLEGLPLALEIVAARAGMLSLFEIRESLEKRFARLDSEQSTDNRRHRSLRAACLWSYELLPVDLRPLFSGLAVFHGGWTLEAAAAVCEYEDIRDGLDRLRIFSLITVKGNEGRRWQMLETLREFAAEQISGETHARLMARHAAYYAEQAETRQAQIADSGQIACLKWIGQEYENLMTALLWEMEHTDRPRLLNNPALRRYWHLHARAEDLVPRLLSRLPAEETARLPMRAAILLRIGALHIPSGKLNEARKYLKQALEIHERRRDQGSICGALSNLAYAEKRAGNLAQALDYQEQIIEVARASGNLVLLAEHLYGMGDTYKELKDYSRAVAYFEEARTLSSAQKDLRLLEELEGAIGQVAEAEGNFAEAIARFQRARQMARERGALLEEVTCGYQLGRAQTRLGDYPSARTTLAETLPLALQTECEGFLLAVLSILAMLACAEQAYERSARLYRYVRVRSKAIGRPISPLSRSAHKRGMEEVIRNLGRRAYWAACRRGRVMTQEEALSCALEPLDR